MPPGNSALPTVANGFNPATGKHCLTVSYRRRIILAPLTYALPSTPDPITWTTIPGANLEQVGTTVPTGDGVTELATVRVQPAIEDSPLPRFVHLNVTISP